MADYSLADIAAMMGKDKEGLGGAGWLILLFIFIFALGGNGGFFGGRPYPEPNGNGNYVTQSEMQSAINYQSTAGSLNEIRAAQCATDYKILETSAATNLAIQTNKYENLLGVKDIENRMEQCCCNLKATVIEQNQMTRDLIQANYISGLQSALNEAQNEIDNARQTTTILGTLGKWYANNPIGTGGTTPTGN